MFIDKLITFFKKRKQQKINNEWKDGYDWAVGSLLRGEETPLSIEAYSYGMETDSFDKGASAGINRLINLGYKDNRF